MNMLLTEEPTERSDRRQEVILPLEPMKTKRLPAVSCMVAGMAIAIVAVLVLVTAISAPPSQVSEPAVPDQDVAALATDVGMTDVGYEPGHSSGWHVHPGVHAVVVLAGTLTIYDQQCQRLDVGPGESYLGGAEPHLARNETSARVDLVVTRVYERSAPLGHGRSVATPAACDGR